MPFNDTKPNIVGVSILIPVFNFDIHPLINCLLQNKTSFDFEIIMIDDCSTIKTGFSNKNNKVTYIELPQNIGRSKIRNLLARYANYSHLLFLDCDVMPQNTSYLQQYDSFLSSNNVIYGGNMYENMPSNFDYILHWKAGFYKEQKSAFERSKNPYASFITYNFLIPKNVFLTILFDEKIIGYGHEDTKFGIQLKNNNLPIIHIDNAVFHLGLSTNVIFIEKTKTAVDNLCKLIINENIGVDTKLFLTYLKLKKLYLLPIFNFLLLIINPIIYWNLKSKTPFLVALDLLKLHRMMKYFRK